MSVTYTAYLMLGVRMPREKFPGSIWDDRWLPHSEGWDTVEIHIEQDDDFVYIGKTIARWNRLSVDPEDSFVEYVPDSEQAKMVDSFVWENLVRPCNSAKLMFFVIAS